MSWQKEYSPKQLGRGEGWFGELNQCYRYNREYVVMTRPVQTEWGEVIHACIRNKDNTDIPWAKKQWIKNSLFGFDRIAIEVFPTKDRLIDDANMYHLWILPKGFNMPFGIHPDDMQ